MKTIKINKATHRISAALERAILRIADNGPAGISDFSEGSRRLYQTNAVAAARNLPAETGGALVIRWTFYDADKIPAKIRASRPRVSKWVMGTTTQRLNLVAKKLRSTI